MGTRLDLVGKRFGRWLVLEEHSERIKRKVYYKCQCDCGVVKLVFGSRIKRGGSLSCGCLYKEVLGKCNKTHGLSKSPIYTLWLNVRKRCYDKKTKQYTDYGGRGIRMYHKWKDNPVAFIKWCENNGWQKGLQLDRENNNGHYVPSNLRFITQKEQKRNTRKNVFFTHKGETKCLSEWAEVIGVNYSTICVRIRRGWTIYEAIFGKKDKKTWKNLNT